MQPVNETWFWGTALQDAEYFEAKKSRGGRGGRGGLGRGNGGNGNGSRFQQQAVNELDDGAITDAQIAELAGGLEAEHRAK